MYDLTKAWDTGLRLQLQRRSAYLHRLVFVAGGVFLAAGAGLYFLGAGFYGVATPVGCGLALLFGAGFLLEFYRGRPVAFVFDHEERALIVEERDGRRAHLSYDSLRELRLRRQARRWIVYLSAIDGSYWDLSAFAGRRPALDFLARLRDRLPLAAPAKARPDRVAARPDPVAGGPAYEKISNPGGDVRVVFRWRDRLTLRGSLYMMGLIAGFALAAAGLLDGQIDDPLVVRGLVALPVLIELYLVFFLLRGLGQWQVVALTADSLQYGRGRAATVTGRFRATRSVPRENIARLWFSFDLQSGLQRFLLLNADAARTLNDLYNEDGADFRTAWQAVGARLRTPHISLSGLSLGDSIALRAELEALLFS